MHPNKLDLNQSNLTFLQREGYLLSIIIHDSMEITWQSLGGTDLSCRFFQSLTFEIEYLIYWVVQNPQFNIQAGANLHKPFFKCW